MGAEWPRLRRVSNGESSMSKKRYQSDCSGAVDGSDEGGGAVYERNTRPEHSSRSASNTSREVGGGGEAGVAVDETGVTEAVMEVTVDGGVRRADGEAVDGEAMAVGDATVLAVLLLLRGDIDAKAEAKKGIAPAL